MKSSVVVFIVCTLLIIRKSQIPHKRMWITPKKRRMLKFCNTSPYLTNTLTMQKNRKIHYHGNYVHLDVWDSCLFKFWFMCTNFHQVFFLLQRNNVLSELHKLCHLSRVLYALLIHSDIPCKILARTRYYLQDSCKDLARNVWPYKILACDVWSCKILARYVWDVRILQDPCKKVISIEAEFS